MQYIDHRGRLRASSFLLVLFTILGVLSAGNLAFAQSAADEKKIDDLISKLTPLDPGQTRHMTVPLEPCSKK